MLIIAGIVPFPDISLVEGTVEMKDDSLSVSGYTVPCFQGTSAMASAALTVSNALRLSPPYAVLGGDTGSGKGSRLLYEHLAEKLEEYAPRVLALHYWLPNLGLIKNVVAAAAKLPKRPVMIADAASMYAAKAAGLAEEFDIFTPDVSEMAFLADRDAIHPAYINQHLFESCDNEVPGLIEEAYRLGGAAKLLIVKGAVDYIARKDGIKYRIDEPDVPEMECIGGTGDTITGMAAALVHAGFELEDAAVASVKANRLAGKAAGVTPVTKISELIRFLPDALDFLGINSMNRGCVHGEN